MTFPKLVAHAALAGLYGGFIVSLFIRLANPAAPDDRLGAASGAFVVVAMYTLAAAALWPLLYAGLRFFASHRLRLDWLNLRYLNGFAAVNTAVILAAGWTMLTESRWVLPPGDMHHLTRACVILTIGWLACACVSAVPALRRRPGLQGAASAIALAAFALSLGGRPSAEGDALAAGALSPVPGTVASPAVPAPASGTATSSTGAGAPVAAAGRRLVLLNFDGADLDTILTMQAQGKLPAFARLVEEGTYGRLASLTPCVAPVTRATLVTGMLPLRHGVRGDVFRRVLGRGPRIDVVPPGIGFDTLLSPCLERRATSVSGRRSPALWEISRRQGGLGQAAGWDVDLDAVFPPGRDDSGPAPADWMSDLVDPEVLRQKEEKPRALVREIARAAAADAAALDALRRFETGERRGVIAVSFPGLDRVAHVLLRYARPADFGNVSARDIDLFGPVLERYYRRIDDILGEVLRVQGRNGLVLVTATHGIAPAPALRRLRDEILGGEHLSGVHGGAPGGFLFAHGADVARGRVFGKGAIADVTPTALYALGLPVARDAHGSILAGVFSEPYTVSHPVTVIESYDTIR